MISILLTILKISGMILLTVLGIILALIILVLFVPIRYQITAHRRVMEEAPVVLKIRITWLLHLISASFGYPEETYIRLKLLGFTIFRSDKTGEKKTKKSKPKKKKNKQASSKSKEASPVKTEEPCERRKSTETEKRKPDINSQEEGKDNQRQEREEDFSRQTGKKDFLKKLIFILKNIKYTIIRICDKIKHIITNIRYYIDLIKSDTFRSVWTRCSPQVFSLLRSILPKKIQGSLTVGTGDPASTGQVMAAYGILYPLLGNHIDIIPDFERQIVEGDLLIKGKITLFRLAKTAWIVYFNKDLHYLIKLLKREAV